MLIGCIGIACLAPGGARAQVGGLPVELPEAPEVALPLPPAPAPPPAPQPLPQVIPTPMPLLPLVQSPGPGPAGSLKPTAGRAPTTGTTHSAFTVLGGDGGGGAAGVDSAQPSSPRAARAPARGQGSRPGLASRWDEPLRGAKLKRLRRRMLDHWSCAGILSNRQRRAVVLRAGLFGRKPASRVRIASRLDVSLRRALRVERTGIRSLTRAGACISAGGAAVGTSVYPAAPDAAEAAGAGAVDGTREGDIGGVLGVEESRVGVARPPLDGMDEIGGGVPLPLVASLVVLLALLSAAALATRNASVPAPILLARRFRPSSGKPLLFLDVDGVIALWPFEGDLPPHRSYEFGYVQVVVSDRCGELVRSLTPHFEIVLATGWDDKVTRALGRILGLGKDLRALKFGAAARGGSSDWKIATIERAAGARPAAWVDDAIGPVHERWAGERAAPTKLVKPQRNVGLTDEHVRELLQWAESIGGPPEGRFAGNGRAAREPVRR